MLACLTKFLKCNKSFVKASSTLKVDLRSALANRCKCMFYVNTEPYVFAWSYVLVLFVKYCTNFSLLVCYPKMEWLIYEIFVICKFKPTPIQRKYLLCWKIIPRPCFWVKEIKKNKCSFQNCLVMIWNV